MAFCAIISMAGITGNFSRSVEGNNIPFAWLQRIRIIMTIVAGYISIYIGRFCRACAMTFLTCDILVHGMFFMGYYMTRKTVSSAVLMRFYSQCLGNKRFT